MKIIPLIEGKLISTMKPGTIITRVEPQRTSKMVDPHYTSGRSLPEKKNVERWDYCGKPYLFLGVANNMIYLESTLNPSRIPEMLYVEKWQEGWALYEAPEVIKKRQEEK